jgi:hypothetical protein
MKRRSIARLRRLIKLTEHLYEQEARTAKELVRARDDATKAAAVTREYLDHDNLVGSVFPELVSARAVKLQRLAGELGVEADQQIDLVAAARGRVKGLESKLGREVAGDEHDRNAAMLDEAIEQFVRRRFTSLR